MPKIIKTSELLTFITNCADRKRMNYGQVALAVSYDRTHLYAAVKRGWMRLEPAMDYLKYFGYQFEIVPIQEL